MECDGGYHEEVMLVIYFTEFFSVFSGGFFKGQDFLDDIPPDHLYLHGQGGNSISIEIL